MAKRPAGKHWCFTLNNPAAEDILPDGEDVSYMVVGRESCPTTGTPHWQGYVAFKVVHRLTQLKKLMPRAHWEQMRGTSLEAANYCKKDGDFDEYGNLPLTGGEATKRNWDQARQLAISGDLELIPASIYIPYYNTLKRIKTDHALKVAPMEELNNEWHYGPTGTGKSRAVRTLYPDAFIKDANKWWDGYQGEKVVIIEDVDRYDIKLGRYIKLWGDHYAFPADMKNQGKLDIRPSMVIITSNYAPDEIWNDEKTYAPITRRYKLIKYS